MPLMHRRKLLLLEVRLYDWRFLQIVQGSDRSAKRGTLKKTRAQILHYLFQVWQTRDLGLVDHCSFCWQHLKLGLHERACWGLTILKLFNVVYLSVCGYGEWELGCPVWYPQRVHSGYRPLTCAGTWILGLYHSLMKTGRKRSTKNHSNAAQPSLQCHTYVDGTKFRAMASMDWHIWPSCMTSGIISRLLASLPPDTLSCTPDWMDKRWFIYMHSFRFIGIQKRLHNKYRPGGHSNSVGSFSFWHLLLLSTPTPI